MKILTANTKLFLFTPIETKLINILFISVSVYLLIIFILPKDILSRFDILNSFVNFMSTFIPNIKAVSSKSEIPESATFYMSLGIVHGALFTIFYLLLTIPAILRYYGFGKYKDNPYIFHESSVKGKIWPSKKMHCFNEDKVKYIMRTDKKLKIYILFFLVIVFYFFFEYFCGSYFDKKTLSTKVDVFIFIGVVPFSVFILFVFLTQKIFMNIFIRFKMPDLYRKYLKKSLDFFIS